MNTVVSNLSGSWNAAEPRKKVMLIAGLAAAGIVLWLFVRMAMTPTMALLYSGLESSAASGVIEGLDRQGVPYQVRGDSIFVPADQRDRVRIALAGQGLPAAGSAGYELLDGISGFGTTAEMFDAAYWRAKEGELARTILASPRVVRARVHIAQKKRRPFETETPVTASVTVSTSSGALSRQQAEAIRFLVASAVAGLALNNVAVIDQENGVILRSGEETAKTTADEAEAQAEELRRSVTRILEARVGAGAAIVEVSVETSRDSETIRERLLDPDSKIVVHTDTEESTDDSEGDANAVTVAANLADGDVEGGGEQTTRQSSRTRERVNYEVSETVRERVKPPGEIRRITVAVLVDGVRVPGDGGEATWAPRSEEELAALRDLVESTVGYDEERGDKVTIQSMEFTLTEVQGTAAQSGFMSALSANAMSIVQLLTLGIVGLLLGLFVIRPILTAGGGGAAGALGADGGGEDFYLPGGDDMSGGDGGGFDMFTGGGAGDALAMPSGDMIGAGALEVDRRDLLESTVAEKPEEAVRQISKWLDGNEAERSAA